MEFKNNTLLALSLVAFVPTISILFTLNYNDDELTSQIFFMVCKLWLFFAPAYHARKCSSEVLVWAPALVPEIGAIRILFQDELVLLGPSLKILALHRPQLKIDPEEPGPRSSTDRGSVYEGGTPSEPARDYLLTNLVRIAL